MRWRLLASRAAIQKTKVGLRLIYLYIEMIHHSTSRYSQPTGIFILIQILKAF